VNPHHKTTARNKPFEADESTSPPWQINGCKENLLNPHLKTASPEIPLKSRNQLHPPGQELDVWDNRDRERCVFTIKNGYRACQEKKWLEQRLFSHIGTSAIQHYYWLSCQQPTTGYDRSESDPFSHECNSLRAPRLFTPAIDSVLVLLLDTICDPLVCRPSVISASFQ
jgi:hypothetical protein